MAENTDIEWPREIWLAELGNHHNGRGEVVLSEFSTGNPDSDREFHEYVDKDILDSAESYHKAKIEELRARIDALRNWIEDEAADRGDADAEYEVHRQCWFALNEI